MIKDLIKLARDLESKGGSKYAQRVQEIADGLIDDISKEAQMEGSISFPGDPYTYDYVPATGERPDYFVVRSGPTGIGAKLFEGKSKGAYEKIKASDSFKKLHPEQTIDIKPAAPGDIKVEPLGDVHQRYMKGLTDLRKGMEAGEFGQALMNVGFGAEEIYHPMTEPARRSMLAKKFTEEAGMTPEQSSKLMQMVDGLNRMQTTKRSNDQSVEVEKKSAPEVKEEPAATFRRRGPFGRD